MNNEIPIYNSRITKTYLEYVRNSYPGLDTDSILEAAGMAPYEVDDPAQSDNRFIIKTERLLPAFSRSGLLSYLNLPEESGEPLIESFISYVDYLVFMAFESPAFLENEDGVFKVDWINGRARASINRTASAT